jgi:hypothetical protein
VEQGERRPAAREARQIAVRVGDDEILVSWHAPCMPPEGQAHCGTRAEKLARTSSSFVVDFHEAAELQPGPLGLVRS